MASLRERLLGRNTPSLTPKSTPGQNGAHPTPDALTRGRPVTDRDAGSPLSKAYVQLAAKLGGTSDASPINGTRPAESGGSRLSRLLRRGK